MLQKLRQGLVRNWIGLLTCLVLGTVLFAVGYWQGQRSALQNGHPAYPMPPPGSNLPANATPEMKEFMENRVTLMQKMAELRHGNPNGAPDPKAFAQFREQNKALLDRQQQLAQILGQQQAQNPLPEPPPLQIPANASPQLKACLTARDQLMRDQVAFMNQHRTDDPATRQAAMQEWHRQNAARFQQLQQQEQALAQTTPGATPAAPPKPTAK